jgi:hypothetical protein
VQGDARCYHPHCYDVYDYDYDYKGLYNSAIGLHEGNYHTSYKRPYHSA